MSLEQRIAIKNARQEEAARRFLGKVLDTALVTINCAIAVGMLILISD